MRNCNACSAPVEDERVELLDSHVCAACAAKGIAQPPTLKGAMIYGHKTAGELAVMPSSTFDLHRSTFGRIGQQSILRKVSPSKS